MSKLRVRVYNVLFGDAILVSVPDKNGSKTEIRHILIDVGNVLAGSGGDEVFEPISRNIKKELGNRPLDLYVMTHEHLDHVKGLLYASKNLGLNLNVDYAWLTASAAEDYYDRYPKAQKKRALFSLMYERIEKLL